MPKVNIIDVLFILEKLDVGCFYHFGWFVRVLFSDKNQTIIFSFWVTNQLSLTYCFWIFNQKVSGVSMIYVPLISQWNIFISKRGLPPHFCQTMFSLLKKNAFTIPLSPFSGRTEGQKMRGGGGVLWKIHRDHPCTPSAHFWAFVDPPYVSINSTERQQKLPFFDLIHPDSLLT